MFNSLCNNYILFDYGSINIPSHCLSDPFTCDQKCVLIPETEKCILLKYYTCYAHEISTTKVTGSSKDEYTNKNKRYICEVLYHGFLIGTNDIYDFANCKRDNHSDCTRNKQKPNST